jgi:peptide chain release factor 2
LTGELDREAAALDADLLRERTALLFSGEYDERSALLSISAGAGGTEATDWAEMLLRMYLRWAERHRFHTEVVDQQEGEQAGLKSVTLEVNGRAAYGWLRVERGVHRLVRISPFDSQKRRQTTFALVEVLPEVDDDVEIELDWDEVRVDTFRAQGAGGQHVNKTDSAVRLTHLPTGIVAQSQNERSQTQNKETAIKVLKSRLLERALEEKEAELRKLRGEHVEAGWGNQIRSYVLHPYQMVKDLRTNYETGNTSAVLDGDLDAFMQAELERLATGGESARGDDRDAGENATDGEVA